MKSYRVLLDRRKKGQADGVMHISEEGAKLIYQAYINLHGNSQSMDKRESRGGICWLSEIKYWQKIGQLPNDLKLRDYQIEKEL